MRTIVATSAAVLTSIAFVVVLLVGDDSLNLVVSNLGQLAAATLASVACLVAGRRRADERRRAWWFLGAGTGSWALGQTAWTWYEVVLGRSTPFPSVADIGFLLFPVLGATGLVIFLGHQTHLLAARGRDVVDGAIIAGALLVLSWMTTLGSVVRSSGDTWSTLVLSLAYPVGDIVVATLILIALAQSHGSERRVLALLAVGLGGLAVSDSAYVYVVSEQTFSSTSLMTTGWVVGFLFVAVAGFVAAGIEEGDVVRPASTADPVPSSLRAALPFAPVVAAGSGVVVHLLTSVQPSRVDVVLGTALVGMVLVRQFLAALDNQRLLVALGEARDELHHQAMHDDLTGLANRALFAERLDFALMRPQDTLSVLYCDLDDFKLVNDAHGHAVGDAFLVEVAQRLLACVRSSDTVARIGGDEFAVLLLDAERSDAVAERIADAVRAITHVGPHAVDASISVGLDRRLEAVTPAAGAEVVEGHIVAQRRSIAAAELLRAADTAMYAAKLARKGRTVQAGLVVPLASPA